MRNKFLLLTAICSIASCSTPLTNSELEAKADARFKTLEKAINETLIGDVMQKFEWWNTAGKYNMDENETQEAQLANAINAMPNSDKKTKLVKAWNCFIEARKAYNGSKGKTL